MKKYINLFALWYLIAVIALGIVSYLFNINSASTSIASIIAAGMAAGSSFAKDYNRPPTPEEKSSFAWGATFVIVAFTTIALALIYFFGLSDKEAASISNVLSSGLFLGMFGGLVIFILLVSFWAARWSFGWYATKRLN